jgi:hypothetical protein
MKNRKIICVKCCIDHGNKKFGDHDYCDDCFDLLNLGNFEREILELKDYHDYNDDLKELIDLELELII